MFVVWTANVPPATKFVVQPSMYIEPLLSVLTCANLRPTPTTIVIARVGNDLDNCKDYEIAANRYASLKGVRCLRRENSSQKNVIETRSKSYDNKAETQYPKPSANAFKN